MGKSAAAQASRAAAAVRSALLVARTEFTRFPSSAKLGIENGGRPLAGCPPAESFTGQFGKFAAAMVAVPFVIAPVFVSKLSAKDATPVRTEDIPMLVPREKGKGISTVSVLASCLNTGVPSPPTVYLASLDDPVPETPDRSMIRMTDGGCGGRVVLVSSTNSLETRAWPENLTLSGCPLTEPETGMSAMVGA